MKYNEHNKPLICMMTQSYCYNHTTVQTVKGICWHDTACDNTYIKRYVQPSDNAPDKDRMLEILGVNKAHNDWNHNPKRTAGVNAFVGKLADGNISSVQVMPWNYRCNGVGGGKKGTLNNGWLQFEICEDAMKNKAYADAVYKEACELTAYLCKMFNIDPNGTALCNGVKVPTICCHGDASKLGLGDGHVDIYDWLPTFGLNMETARKDITKLLADNAKPDDNKKEDGKVYFNEFPTIKKGARGIPVKVAQSILGATIDGDFGNKTDTRVRAFQKEKSLYVDGIVGPKTWEALMQTMSKM